jgi:hypothetical protein
VLHDNTTATVGPSLELPGQCDDQRPTWTLSYLARMCGLPTSTAFWLVDPAAHFARGTRARFVNDVSSISATSPLPGVGSARRGRPKERP